MFPHNLVAGIDLSIIYKKIKYLTIIYKFVKNQWDIFISFSYVESKEINTCGDDDVCCRRRRCDVIFNNYYII